jgi:hypothetical protein
MESALLFLIFNRPETTRKVFEAIRLAKPKRLYLAADGARPNNKGEVEKVKQVRDIVYEVDWECRVRTLFREKNLGCKMAVSSAISWFFDQEEEGIILEDDCLPNQSFFLFCQELLDFYRGDSRIMAISGDNFQQGTLRNNYSYYFSRYNHVWGWASWRRAWLLFDRDLRTWPEVKTNRLLEYTAGGNQGFLKFWTEMFDRCYAGEIDTWGWPWMYSCWVQSGLTILPNVNLVSNIGFGESATHTKAFVENQAALETKEMIFPLKHPPWVARDVRADGYMDFNVLRIGRDDSNHRNWYFKIINAVKRMAK